MKKLFLTPKNRFRNMRTKILCCASAALFLFFAQTAYSISVNPKSKTALRNSLKKYSASRNTMDATAKRKGAAKSGRKKTSRSNTYGSGEKKDQIVYTMPDPKDFQPATLVDVEDGDTIRVLLDSSPFTVSLYGIDAPERTQTHGVQAMQVLRKLLKRKKIRLQIYDKERASRRCLAVVSVGEKNVNELLVKGGHVWEKKKYCYESFCSDWLAYQKEAEEAKKGLWSYPEPRAPWLWRAMPPEKRHDLQQGYSPVANGLRSRYGKDTTIIGP
ncbi:MAG: hypothetical protein D3904_01905 [Candidatus Electrothrix sp. EH2]|nr:hypothetical protein [Candidatus Electrothrix sp. EH2]